MQVESLGNFIGRSEAAYQQDEKAYLRELAQYEYGKYGLDDYLKINRQFTETEKEQARIFMKKFDAQTSNEFRKYAGNRDGMGAKPMPESVRILQKKREALGAKVSRGDGAFYGLMNGLTFGAARNKENRSNTQYLEQYATQTTPLTPDQQAHQQILRSYGGKSSFDVAKENQAGPYFVGTALGEVGKYYVGAKLGSAAPGLGGVQKASTKLSKLTKGAISEDAFRNLIAGRVAEMPFDAAAIGADAQSWDDFAKRFAVSQLQGLAFDGAFEGMSQIVRSVQGRLVKNPLAKNMNPSNLSNSRLYSNMEEKIDDNVQSVKWYRVQGGEGEKSSQPRIETNSDGTLRIMKHESNLNVSTITKDHARYYLNRKRESGYVVEFEVPKWFDDFMREYAVPQKFYRSNPDNQRRMAPKRVDPHQPGLSYELPTLWVEWLEEYGFNARIIRGEDF